MKCFSSWQEEQKEPMADNGQLLAYRMIIKIIKMKNYKECKVWQTNIDNREFALVASPLTYKVIISLNRHLDVRRGLLKFLPHKQHEMSPVVDMTRLYAYSKPILKTHQWPITISQML